MRIIVYCWLVSSRLSSLQDWVSKTPNGCTNNPTMKRRSFWTGLHLKGSGFGGTEAEAEVTIVHRRRLREFQVWPSSSRSGINIVTETNMIRLARKAVRFAWALSRAHRTERTRRTSTTESRRRDRSAYSQPRNRILSRPACCNSDTKELSSRTEPQLYIAVVTAIAANAFSPLLSTRWNICVLCRITYERENLFRLLWLIYPLLPMAVTVCAASNRAHRRASRDSPDQRWGPVPRVRRITSTNRRDSNRLTLARSTVLSF